MNGHWVQAPTPGPNQKREMQASRAARDTPLTQLIQDGATGWFRRPLPRRALGCLLLPDQGQKGQTRARSAHPASIPVISCPHQAKPDQEVASCSKFPVLPLEPRRGCKSALWPDQIPISSWRGLCDRPGTAGCRGQCLRLPGARERPQGRAVTLS